MGEIISLNAQLKQKLVEAQGSETNAVTQQTFMTEAQEPEAVATEATATAVASDSASNWFTDQGTAQSEDNTWQQLEQQVEQQQDQQQNQQEEKLQTSSDVNVGGEVNVAELQFKLLWYEEQWGTWTAHFTQLQESYQAAELQIAQLQQRLQTAQNQEQDLDESNAKKETEMEKKE